MKKNEFLLEIDELLELDEGTLKGEEVLSDFEEWDSLAVISFIALADEKFDFIINGNELIEAKKVADLLNLVAEHIED